MTDLRQFARQTQNRLLIGLLILLFTIGIALIYWFYGRQAALFGLFCLAALLVPIFLIVLILHLIERGIHHEQE